MKVKKIVELCKKRGVMLLFEGGGIQWLSDGQAVYPLYDMPYFDIESLCNTYDVPEAKRNKISYKHKPLPFNLCFDDLADGEMKVEKQRPHLVINGIQAVPVFTSQGVHFIDQQHLAPLADMDSLLLEIFERQTESDQIYFAVKKGMVLVAIIPPVDIVDQTMVKQLKGVVERCEVALFNKEANATQPEQTTMNSVIEDESGNEAV